MKIKEKITKNKKIQKLNEYKNQIQTIWDNPKQHAIIMLSIWFIIILILSLIVRIKDTTAPNEPIKVEPSNQEPTNNAIKEQLQNISTYEANITINSIEQLTITQSTNGQLINQNTETYFYDSALYTINNNELTPTENTLINDINYFNTSNIYNLIKDTQEEYITIYKDNSYNIKYNIKINEFWLKYKNETLNTEENIGITITGTNQINTIEIDLTNLQNINNYYINKITINLTNINNIEKINLNNQPQEKEWYSGRNNINSRNYTIRISIQKNIFKFRIRRCHNRHLL